MGAQMSSHFYKCRLTILTNYLARLKLQNKSTLKTKDPQGSF